MMVLLHIICADPWETCNMILCMQVVMLLNSIPVLNAKTKHFPSWDLKCSLFLHSTTCVMLSFGTLFHRRTVEWKLIYCVGNRQKTGHVLCEPHCVTLPFAWDGRWPKCTLSFAGCPHNKFSFSSSGECCCSTLRLHPPATVHLWPLSRVELRALLLSVWSSVFVSPPHKRQQFWEEKKNDSFVI